MATFLFDSIVFGPVQSRRLGVSLGINLLPVDGKLCTFDCVYCECGLNAERQSKGNKLPNVMDFTSQLEHTLLQMHKNGKLPDVITFAGNGEPTLHPQFDAIIDITIRLRDKYAPRAKVSVLSNATQVFSENVFIALQKVDMNILKLDSAITNTVRVLNRPVNKQFDIDYTIQNLKRFNGKLIIQTLFCRGEISGERFDNTQPQEIELWLKALKEIKPESVMLYSISRDTPIETIQKVLTDELENIAKQVKELGIKAEVS